VKSTPLQDQDRPRVRPPARAELGAFLRARREGLSPEQVGLPATRRRRTPGLRREELAVLAGVSVTWCTWLEQGRNVRASEQVLGALAGALGLSGPERTYLFALAGAEQDRPLDEEVPQGLAGVVAALAPHPAYVTGALFDVLAVNDAALELFAGPDGSAGRPTNLARWMFTQPAAREVLVDWEQVARDLLARLRAATGRQRSDARAAVLVAELRSSSAQADAWWQRYDVAAPHAGTKRLRHPRDGEVTMVYTALAVADHPDQTLVVYTPPQHAT